MKSILRSLFHSSLVVTGITFNFKAEGQIRIASRGTLIQNLNSILTAFIIRGIDTAMIRFRQNIT